MLAKRVFVASIAFAALTVSGCMGCSDEAYPGYCDTSGCYACNGPDFTNCWPVNHDSCSTDNDCPAGLKCTDIGCTAGCTSDAECDNGEVCDGTTNLCAPAGVSPTPINHNPNPDPILVPESCTTDEECQKADPALVCDNGKCIDACTSDADCEDGYVCAECGKCTPEDTPSCGDATIYCDVTDASSCGANRACLTGHCHVTCDAASDCPIGQICQAAVCVDDPSPQSPECVFDANCTALGQQAKCINGYCHPLCTEDANCGPAEICHVGVCMPDYRPAP